MSSESNIQAATLQDLRRAALFDPSTGICMPSKPGRECWNPIFNTALPDITAIANRITQHALTPEGRRILDERRAHDIPDINPFAPSRIRTRGFRLWDAAVHVPRSAFTQGKLLAIRDIQPVRRINSYWREDTQRALRRVEPIEPYRQLYRRRGPFIFDLLEDRHRILLQAAHVLAHHRGDHADLDLDPIDPVTLPTARLFQQALGELLVASLFNLPFDIGSPQDPYPMRPHLPFGLTVCPTVFDRNPILAVPMNGSLPLRLDDTLAVLDIVVDVAGPPLDDQQAVLLPPDPKHARRCQPTSVEFVGFELLDVITHHDVAAPYPDAKEPRLHWAVHHLDLMPPQFLAEYVQAGQAAGLRLTERGYWRLLPEWFDSDEFREMLLRTPPLPCPYCMMWTHGAKGYLARPLFPPRTKAGYRSRDDWRLYFQKARDIRNCIDKSRDALEPDEMRKQQRANHKAKLEKLKEGKWFNEAAEKMRRGYAPTGRHLRAVEAHQAELQRQQTASAKPAA